MRKKVFSFIIAALLTVSSAGVCRANDADLWTTSVTPDALIILDLSGSMLELPQGTKPTFYIHSPGQTCSSYSGPFYTSNTGTDCLPLTGGVVQLYNDTSCTSTSTPYTTTSVSYKPTGDFYVAGVNSTNCGTSYTGAYYSSTTIPSDQLIVGTNVYAATTCSPIGGGPFYKNSGGSYTKACPVSTTFTNTTIYTSASDCSTGPFYTSSGSGHTKACTQYYKCTSPLSGNYTVYSSGSDCTVSPYYRNSGSGHLTACLVSPLTCTISQDMYSATSDCSQSTTFYKTPSSGYTTCHYSCNNPCTTYGNNSNSTNNIPWSTDYADPSLECSGPFYESSGTGYTTSCSKVSIAKRSLFKLMDANGDGTLNSTDIDALGMRIGFERYASCSSSDNYTGSTPNADKPWYSGCEKVVWDLTTPLDASGNPTSTTPTPYANIYCNNSTCASTVTSCTGSHECIVGYTPSTSAMTPLGDALKEARLYLNWHKMYDTAATCRQKSIIVITDGADTLACGASGSTGVSQRRYPLLYTQLAKSTKYNVYVVGFGATMPDTLQNTLNWMAYYGGTKNPNVTQSGDTSKVAVDAGTSTRAPDPCNYGTDPGACSGSIDGNGNCKTSSNSQYLLYPLSGYAFLAGNPNELASALQSAITSIQSANYSFSAQASVAAARVQEENFIYEASFEPKNIGGVNKEPFWTGHLKKYQIGNNGLLQSPYCWDAGVVLNQSTDAGDRNMWTYKNGSSLTAFNTTNITAADLAITGSATQTAASVVGFYRGESAYNQELVNGQPWKLGDLFHTNPVVVKTPQQFFYDPRECDATSFAAFRTNHQRTAANGNQLIIAGANDGQLHCFHTGSSSAGTDCSGGGDEAWSFIPPNLLQKIAPIAHYDHTNRAALASHSFFIDGPLQVFDAWIPSSNSSGITKNASDWKTVAVFAEGQGSGSSYLWSSSSTCYSTDTTYFSATFSTTLPTTTNPTQYYCGLYALDVTDTTATSPNYMWHLMPTTAQAPYLGEAWSKMQIGRVNIGGNEKWVGFIGGGYDSSACLSADGTTSTACNTPATGSAGKGFFVVDLRDGSILWSYTHANNSNMNFSAPASPLPLDTDSDGFIDTVYMGDLGGNMWRFRLCPMDSSCSYCGKTDGYTASPCTSCSTSNWTGSLLFTSTNTERGSGLSTPTNTHKQIFTQAIATKDPNGKVWVYFGTGENNDPTTRPADTSATKNRIYAIKDSDFTTTYTSSNLTDISSTPLYDYSSIHGWYKNLSTNTLTRSDGTSITSPTGEKMISDMALFNNILYFSTYIPDQGTTNACGLAGDTFEYLIDCFYGLGAANATDLAAARAAIAAYQAAAAAAAANPGGTTLAAAAAAALAAAQAAVNNTANDNTKYIGHGIGSSMLVSYRPGYTDADIYVTASGGAGTPELTQSMGQAPKPPNMTNVLYWKDRRLQ